MRKCKQKRKQENAKTRNTKRENPKTRKAQKNRKGENTKTREPKNTKTQKEIYCEHGNSQSWCVISVLLHVALASEKKKEKKNNQIWHLNWEGSISTWYVYTCMRLFVHIYTYTYCCLAMNMPCISCWISWSAESLQLRWRRQLPCFLVPGTFPRRSLCFSKYLAVFIRSQHGREMHCRANYEKIWWNNVGWQVDMSALISLLISKSWKSVLISFGVGFACRCTPVLFSWPSDTDPLVQAFGGSC